MKEEVYYIAERLLKEPGTVSEEEINLLNYYTAVWKPNSRIQLNWIIEHYSARFRREEPKIEKCTLNWIDVSEITDMSNLFDYSDLNPDISKWDVSNVTNMSSMFQKSNFNGNISKWDVSNVTNMNSMFFNSKFNKNISDWDVSSVTNMDWTFAYSVFNKDISKWDVSNVRTFAGMFKRSQFNQDITRWKIRKDADTQYMFSVSMMDKVNVPASIFKDPTLFKWS